MDDINFDNSVCQNGDSSQITIDTSDYNKYNLITIHNYYRIFTILGLIALILLVPPLINKLKYIENKYILYIFYGILIIIGLFGITGFIGLMISCYKFYNITERIYIYNNSNLSNKCNITIGYENSDDIYIYQLDKQSIGYIEFTTFFLIIILIVFLINLIIKMFNKIKK